MESNMLSITVADRDDWLHLVNEAVQLTSDRLYIWIQDAPGAADADLLRFVAELLKPVAKHKPRLDMVPLLPFSGWCPGSVANLTDLSGIFFTKNRQEASKALLDRISHLRRMDLPPLHEIALTSHDEESNCQSGKHSDQDEHASSAVEAKPHSSLEFENVAVGGTFDRLHVGHRLLLAAAALVCTKRLYVGVTGDKLLEKKKHHELLEPYEQREAAAVSYLKSVRPGITVQTGALLDPKEPTAAATEEGMQVLVVSKETVSGAEAINQYRREHGFKPLEIIVVDLVADSAAVEGGKISSTALREQDAAAAAARSVKGSTQGNAEQQR